MEESFQFSVRKQVFDDKKDEEQDENKIINTKQTKKSIEIKDKKQINSQ